MLSKINQRKKNMVLLTYNVLPKNIKQISQCNRRRNRLTDIENTLVVISGEREDGRGKMEVGDYTNYYV